MHILVERRWKGTNSTLSVVKIDGVRFGYCLEDRDRDLSVDMPLKKIAEIKVPKKTAIPTGTYQVVVTYSSRFRRRMPLLSGVPGFSGIRIHSGNRHVDTEGCPLLGRRWQKEDKDYLVLESRTLCDSLYEKIDAAIKAGQKVTWEIVSAYESN